ncbi:restriction endonuclease subunit S, partial [Gemmatimonas sp.]|uniref:restriction endonuclease subunit S n=1 Tax=Gemmatimonas sp. TaxID=1962908 RepID=UPI0025BC7CC8
DRETAKIDALVAEQRRLMDLLREKRQAVISHAVTKGLNPEAPMKDSGVEWLGAVPAHWDLNPLKRYIAFITSGSRGWADHYADKGDVFLRIANLTRETIRLDLDDVQRVQVPEGAEGERTRVESGDILFSITAYLGSVAVIPDSFEGGYVSQHVALVRVNKALLEPTFGAYAALSICGQTWFQRQSYGGTKIQLSLDDVRDLPIPVPPIEEQRSIVGFIEAELSRLEEMSAEAMRAVTILNERRAALITAAVTGQIYVRGLALSEAA